MEFDSVKTGSLLNQPEKKKKKGYIEFASSIWSSHLSAINFLLTSTFPSLTFLKSHSSVWFARNEIFA